MDNRTCAVPDCGKGGRIKSGLCPMHYERKRRHGDPAVTITRQEPPRKRAGQRGCAIEGCERPHDAKGLCKKHYRAKQDWPERTCGWCGIRFGYKGNRFREIYYCSLECAGKSRRAPKTSAIRVIECQECAAPFTTHGPAMALQTYCSPKCRRLATYTPQRHMTVCNTCHVEFEAKGPASYCSRQCRQMSPSFRAGRRTYRSRRRARIRSASAEAIDPLDIFERDEWTCGICGDTVDRIAKDPHPMSVNLDHIIPLARGGTHTRDNVQCSHRSCNLAKGDQLPDGHTKGDDPILNKGITIW